MTAIRMPFGGIGTGPDTTTQCITVRGEPVYFDVEA